MKILQLLTICAMIGSSLSGYGADKKDVLKTSVGTVDMTFMGHASMLFQLNGKNIYIDPSSAYAKFDENLPKADIILITHGHFDHFDPKVIKMISKKDTKIIANSECESADPTYIMRNGDVEVVDGIRIEAVPAYNMVHKNPNGDFFHPKGVGNGYVLTIGDKHIYIAGDTENIPEMTNLKNIDVAFLPVNLPYTMDLDMFADAVSKVKAKVVYPYHYTDTNMEALKEKMKGNTTSTVIFKNFY